MLHHAIISTSIMRPNVWYVCVCVRVITRIVFNARITVSYLRQSHSDFARTWSNEKNFNGTEIPTQSKFDENCDSPNNFLSRDSYNFTTILCPGLPQTFITD